jgi:hypothetical protein
MAGATAGGGIDRESQRPHAQTEVLEDGALFIPAPAAQRAPKRGRRSVEPAEAVPEAADQADAAIGQAPAGGHAWRVADEEQQRAIRHENEPDGHLEHGRIDIAQHPHTDRRADATAEHEGPQAASVETATQRAERQQLADQ